MGSISGWVDILIKEFVPEIKRDGGTESRSLVFVPNITNSMAYGTRKFNAAFIRTLQ